MQMALWLVELAQGPIKVQLYVRPSQIKSQRCEISVLREVCDACQL